MAQSSRPQYPIPWIATYFLTALVLLAASFLLARYLPGVGDEYDRYDADFDLLERIARSAEPERGDFSKLNGGAWTALCLAGYGADLSRAPPAIREAFADEPPKAVATEFTLSYVRPDSTVKLLRHPHGYAFARAGALQCTNRDAPVLALPARHN